MKHNSFILAGLGLVVFLQASHGCFTFLIFSYLFYPVNTIALSQIGIVYLAIEYRSGGPLCRNSKAHRSIITQIRRTSKTIIRCYYIITFIIECRRCFDIRYSGAPFSISPTTWRYPILSNHTV
jgi:hypothetical protein